MSNSNITIEVNPTAADYRRALFSIEWKRLAVIVGATVIVVFFVILFLANLKPVGNAAPRPEIYLIPLPIIFLVVARLYFGIWSNAKKTEERSVATVFTFNDEGVETVNTNGSAQANWQADQKVIETAKDFIYFPQPTLFFLLPKRCFESDGQMAAFRDLISQKLGERARLRN